MENNNKTEQTEQEEKTLMKSEKEKQDPVARITRTILIICVVYFVWYLFADRITPYTDQARVRGFTVPVSAQVPGTIVKMNVSGDQAVEEGDVLFEIDDSPYQLAVNLAETELTQASQSVGADTASVAAAQARLVQAKADLVVKRADYDRVIAIENRDIIPKNQIEKVKGQYAQAQAAVVSAQADFERAKQQLGETGKDNARIEAALTALSNAKLNLAWTKIAAPSPGGVSNARAFIGQYAAVGAPIMTFIAKDYVWIEASFRENNLGNIEKGNTVDITLDSAPGQVFEGEVVSIGYGVSFKEGEKGQLAKPTKPQGWLRDPQRFPVTIRFINDDSVGLRREGGQADVVVYTNDNFLLNFLAAVRIHLASWFSYVY